MRAFGPLVLRLVIGAMFIVHGWPKLASLGGSALPPIGEWLGAVGSERTALLASALGAVELLGGILLVVGALTVVAAGTLAVATAVHLWVFALPEGGATAGAIAQFFPASEFSPIVLAALVSLALTGPGALSVDEGRRQHVESRRAGRQRLRGY